MSSSVLISPKFDHTSSYFAFGSVALDVHEIRVQSVNASQANINVSYKLEKEQRITVLTWISANASIFIAVGLSSGNILIYSPLTNEVLETLIVPRGIEIMDIHYSRITDSLWSCDSDGYISEWDIISYSLKQSFSLQKSLDTSEKFTRISTTNFTGAACLVIASFSLYVYDINSHTVIKTLPVHAQPVNNLVTMGSSGDKFLTSSIDDRFITLASLSDTSTKSVFVSSSPVEEIAFNEVNGSSIIVALTEEGNLEVFNNPFEKDSDYGTKTGPRKKRRHQVNTHSPDATIKLTRPKEQIKSKEEGSVPFGAISLNGGNIIYSWLERSSIAHFDVLQWVLNGSYSLEGELTFIKSRNDTFIEHSYYGSDLSSSRHYNEGNAVVSDGLNLNNIDYNDDIDDLEQEESLAEKLEKLTPDAKTNTGRTSKKLSGRHIGSLAVVLSQALRSNDHTLLESVLSNLDSSVIQQTVSRLDPTLAVIFLDRLAERMSRQNTKFDQLNFWLKWVIIVHGGMLSSIPNLNTKLANLHAVLSRKASNLPKLLELQGRLNMLQQQRELRNEILAQDYEEQLEEEASDVEYIEEIDDAEFYGQIDSEEIYQNNIRQNGESEFDIHDDYSNTESEPETNSEEIDVEEGYSDIEADS